MGLFGFFTSSFPKTIPSCHSYWNRLDWCRNHGARRPSPKHYVCQNQLLAHAHLSLVMKVRPITLPRLYPRTNCPSPIAAAGLCALTPGSARHQDSPNRAATSLKWSSCVSYLLFLIIFVMQNNKIVYKGTQCIKAGAGPCLDGLFLAAFAPSRKAGSRGAACGTHTTHGDGNTCVQPTGQGG